MINNAKLSIIADYDYYYIMVDYYNYLYMVTNIKS